MDEEAECIRIPSLESALTLQNQIDKSSGEIAKFGGN